MSFNLYEVQTVLGISGKLWCHQNFGENSKPDIMCIGKKSQVCGIYAGKRIDENKKTVFNDSSRLNSTWGGNLADMVRLSLYVDVIEKEPVPEVSKPEVNEQAVIIEVIPEPPSEKTPGLYMWS